MGTDAPGVKDDNDGRAPRRLLRLLNIFDSIVGNMKGREGLDDALTALIEVVEAAHPGLAGSILLVDESGTRVRNAASPGLPDYYITAVDGLEIAEGVGSCGTAMARGEPVFCEDVLVHPYWETFRPLMERTRLRACWSYPIFNEAGGVIGSFAMYYDEPRLPGARELRTIEVCAGIVARVIGLSGVQQAAFTPNRPS